jgi:hypothetical protein
MGLALAVIMSLAAAAPVAAGPNTSNTSGSGETIQGEWYDGSYGYIVLFEESGGGYGELLEESGEWVLCSTGPTPEDEVYGFVGTRLVGWASAVDIALDSKLGTGSATADFELGIETIDECSGIYDVTFDTATVTVDLVGTGSLAMFRDSGSFKVPGEFNSHSRYRGKERQADGSVDLGSFGSRDLEYGIMASFSWSDHANG